MILKECAAMAKMFYNLAEAAKRLGKSEREVREMVVAGQLQEFRDGDNLVFKREQIDAIAGSHESGINLTDDLEPLSLASSGSSLGMADPGSSGGGISIFDTESTDEADPSAATVMADTAGTTPDFTFDPGASGSGLLGLTREADDTSLGDDLLSDVYGDSAGSAGSMGGIGEDIPAGGDLFETTGSSTEQHQPAFAGMAMIETIDGGASGFSGGAMLGASIACIAALALGAMVIAAPPGGASAATGGLIDQVADLGGPMILGGAMLGVVIVFAGLGFMFGRKG